MGWIPAAGDQSPLTTKGDLYTFDTDDARLAVGSDGQVLKADSTAGTGLAWAAEGSGLVARGVTVRRSTAQAITTATRTAISFDTETRDDGGFWEGVTNPTRVTIPSGGDGWYTITAGLRWAIASGGARQAELRVNGTTLIAINGETNPSTTREVYNAVSRSYYLAAADYVELTVFQDSGGSVNVQTAAEWSPWISVVRSGLG